MAEIVNLETGALETHDDAAAAGLLAKGYRQATPLDIGKRAPVTVQPTTANVVGPFGVGGTVPIEQLADAERGAGYRPETGAETDERVLQQKYGDQYARTFVEGVARGGTLGLFDVVAGDEGVRERRARNSGLAFAGELGGNVALSLLLPGAGAAAAGSKAVARYAPVMARGAAEGALFGTGAGISTVALSKDPMGAEAALHEIGSSALLGGFLGGGLGAAGTFLSDSAGAAKGLAQRHLKPTIADDVIAAAPRTTAAAPVIGDDLARIGKKPPRPDPAVTRTLKAEREAMQAVPEGPQPLASGSGPVSLADNAAPVVDDTITKFKADYHRLDTAARQNIRQMEGLERKGVEITSEMRKAADDLEAARRAMRDHLPLEKERSYDVVDSGPRGGYANKQGKSLQTWKGTDDEIATAVRAPGFREAIWQFEAKLDDMQFRLGNKEYPTVLGEHPALNAPRHVAAPAPAAVNAEAEAFANRAARIDSILSKENRSAADKAFLDETVALAEARGMTLGDGDLNKLIADAGFPGVKAGELSPEAIARLKADAYARMARQEMTQIRAAQQAEKRAAKSVKMPEKKSALSDLIGETMAEKAATAAGAVIGTAVGAGPWLGGMAGRAVLGGPMRKVTEALAGRAGKSMEKLAKGVDVFLEGSAKAVKKAPRLTSAILNDANFETGAAAAESATSKPRTAFDKRAAEMGRVLANPMAARKAIHDSLAGVRMADPLLADQMEDLAFRRLLFLADKMPKNPGIGPLIGKKGNYQPSDAEQAKWARYIHAAENPGDVVDAMANGSLTVEAVETLAELYPTTHARIQQDIVTRAGELQSELTWTQRLTISTLWKVPTDASLRPASILAYQLTYVPVEEEQSSAPAMGGGAMKAPPVTTAQRLGGA